VQQQLLLTSSAAVDIDAGAGTTASIISVEDPLLFSSVQHAVFYVSIEYEKRGELELAIVSPSGVKSIISPIAPEETADYDNWKFMSVKYVRATAAPPFPPFLTQMRSCSRAGTGESCRETSAGIGGSRSGRRPRAALERSLSGS
jgi:hypothetical protein